MSRRTTILVEVSEEVYNTLVEPMKKERTFTKLVSSLINGYLADPYIRSYADDTLEEFHKTVIGDFEETLDSMKESLSGLGLFTDELEASASVNYSKFKKVAEEQAETLSSGKVETPKEVSNTEERLSRLENLVEQSMQASSAQIGELSSLIKGLLAGINLGSVINPVQSKTNPISSQHMETPVVSSVVENPVEKVENLSAPALTIVESTSSDDDDSSDESMTLSALLEGNAFSF